MLVRGDRLCSLGWPGNCYVPQAGLHLWQSSSASQVLGSRGESPHPTLKCVPCLGLLTSSLVSWLIYSTILTASYERQPELGLTRPRVVHWGDLSLAFLRLWVQCQQSKREGSPDRPRRSDLEMCLDLFCVYGCFVCLCDCVPHA